MADTEAAINFTNLNDSVRSLPPGPPVSWTDRKFIEQVVKQANSRKQSVQGVIRATTAGMKINYGRHSMKSSTSSPNLANMDEKEIRKIELRKIMLEKKKEKMDKEKPEEDRIQDITLIDVEKDLWSSGDWREQIKDLNSSFSKLPPISKGKKVVEGKAQAFII